MTQIRKSELRLFAVTNAGAHSPFLPANFSPTCPAPPGTHTVLLGLWCEARIHQKWEAIILRLAAISDKVEEMISGE
jgi:hypothetical protein